MKSFKSCQLQWLERFFIISLNSVRRDGPYLSLPEVLRLLYPAPPPRLREPITHSPQRSSPFSSYRASSVSWESMNSKKQCPFWGLFRGGSHGHRKSTGYLSPGCGKLSYGDEGLVHGGVGVGGDGAEDWLSNSRPDRPTGPQEPEHTPHVAAVARSRCTMAPTFPVLNQGWLVWSVECGRSNSM